MGDLDWKHLINTLFCILFSLSVTKQQKIFKKRLESFEHMEPPKVQFKLPQIPKGSTQSFSFSLTEGVKWRVSIHIIFLNFLCNYINIYVSEKGLYIAFCIEWQNTLHICMYAHSFICIPSPRMKLYMCMTYRKLYGIFCETLWQ